MVNKNLTRVYDLCLQRYKERVHVKLESCCEYYVNCRCYKVTCASDKYKNTKDCYKNNLYDKLCEDRYRKFCYKVYDKTFSKECPGLDPDIITTEDKKKSTQSAPIIWLSVTVFIIFILCILITVYYCYRSRINSQIIANLESKCASIKRKHSKSKSQILPKSKNRISSSNKKKNQLNPLLKTSSSSIHSNRLNQPNDSFDSRANNTRMVIQTNTKGGTTNSSGKHAAQNSNKRKMNK